MFNFILSPIVKKIFQAKFYSKLDTKCWNFRADFTLSKRSPIKIVSYMTYYALHICKLTKFSC